MDPHASVTRRLRRLALGGRPRVLDLFAGCGGLSLGLARAGFEPVAGVEKDALAAASYARNLHGGCQRHGRSRDITRPDETPERLCAELGLGPVEEAVDVVAAGPPCQAFARIGRAKLRALANDPQAFLKDPRTDLHTHWLAWVAAFRPLLVLVENVPDMLNLNGRNLAEEIVHELEELGFQSGYTLLNAVHYGVPQLRERVFLVAWRRELRIEPSFPSPTNVPASLPRGYLGTRQVALRTISRNDLFARRSYVDQPVAGADVASAVTTREAIGDLPSLCPGRDPSTRRGARRFDQPIPWPAVEPSAWARTMRTWAGFEAPADGPRDHVVRYLPRDWPIFARMRPGDEYPAAHAIAEQLFEELVASEAAAGRPLAPESDRWRDLRRATVPPYNLTTFPNRWWKLHPDQPSRTLMAHLGKDGYSHIHYDSSQARTISVREAARLQSFPDGFILAGTMNSAFRQLGNAVPPLLAAALGEHFREQLARAIWRTMRPIAAIG